MQSLLSPWLSIARGLRYVACYGDIFRVRLLLPRQRTDRTRWPLVPSDVVIVASPELIRDLAEQTGPTLLVGEGRQFSTRFPGPDSLIVLDGPDAVDERRWLPPLLGSELLARHRRTIAATATEVFARLPATGHVALARLIDDLMFDVSFRLVFDNPDEADVAALRDAFQGSLESWAWSPAMLLFPALARNYGRWSTGGRLDAFRERFRRVTADEAARRRASGDLGADLFGHLLRLNACEDGPALDRLVSRVLTIISGMDTATVALTWCALHLLRHPEALARACEEAREGPPDRRRSYIEAVCLETLRIHPPIAIALRLATAPVTLGGYTIEAGTWVVGLFALAYRRADIFQEPGRFQPERFLEERKPASVFMPFGAGPRRCPGQTIAIPAMTTVLTTLLRELHMTPARRIGQREGRRWIDMAPRDTLPIEYRRAERPAQPVAPRATRAYDA